MKFKSVNGDFTCKNIPLAVQRDKRDCLHQSRAAKSIHGKNTFGEPYSFAFHFSFACFFDVNRQIIVSVKFIYMNLHNDVYSHIIM